MSRKMPKMLLTRQHKEYLYLELFICYYLLSEREELVLVQQSIQSGITITFASDETCESEAYVITCVNSLFVNLKSIYYSKIPKNDIPDRC